METTNDLCFSEMATALAHEIKNPAAVALAHVNLLRLENPGASLSNHLNHIETALNSICTLVKQMLTTSQIHNNPQEVDLYDILTEILETYRAAWPGISFSFNASEVCSLGLNGEPVLPCYGSAASLRLIFSNLLKNAVEAVEAADPCGEGEIAIDAKYSGDLLHITIHDTGSPINSHQKPHGNGLGLSICRRLALELGAKLSVSPSGGHAVTVSLVTRCPSFA
jgi:signal transduction histidine kinase